MDNDSLFKVVSRKLGIPGPTETILYDIVFIDSQGNEKIMIQSASPSEEMAKKLCEAMNSGLKLGWPVEAIMELISLGREFQKLSKV